jgi:hypothetical protein
MQGDNVEKEDPITHGFFFPVTDLRRLKRLNARIYYSDSLVAESRIEGGKYFSFLTGYLLMYVQVSSFCVH